MHIQHASQNLTDAGLALHDTPLEGILHAIAQSAQQTKDLQQDSLAFQQHFTFED